MLSHVLSSFLCIIALCGCATMSQKHSYSDTNSLVFGKTTPAECRAFFGDPKETDLQTNPEGKIETYRYFEKTDRWGKGVARLLAIEFRDGVLNGYAFLSSFAEDRTTFAVTNLAGVEWAASTREEVSQLLGKPQGKARCPTRLFPGLDRCKATGREIWFYANLEPVPLLTPGRLKRIFAGDICTITFDEHSLVTDISKTQATAF
jgi:hypothetical protein